MKYRDCRGGKCGKYEDATTTETEICISYSDSATDGVNEYSNTLVHCTKQIEQKCVKSHLEHAHGNQIRFTGRKMWNSVLCSDVDKDSD